MLIQKYTHFKLVLSVIIMVLTFSTGSFAQEFGKLYFYRANNCKGKPGEHPTKKQHWLPFKKTTFTVNLKKTKMQYYYNKWDKIEKVYHEQILLAPMNDEILSAKLRKGISRGSWFEFYDHPDCKKDHTWARVDIIKSLDSDVCLNTFNRGVKTKLVHKKYHKHGNDLDGKISCIKAKYGMDWVLIIT